MYDAVIDPYCYPGISVLKNIPGIREPGALERFEAMMTMTRSDEPLPTGRFDVEHYKAIHRHLFQDVYEWAGEFRTVRIEKDGNPFCYPEHIQSEILSLFTALRNEDCFSNLSREVFIQKTAGFLATCNAIHPFREGNGRTQTSFFALLAHEAGHPVDLEKLNPPKFLEAMIASFHDDLDLLVSQMRLMLES